MKSVRISLQALAHPFSLLSIGLLIFNDQVLKVHAPSFLTGKLSDFAGLLFFPYFLIATGGLLSGLLPDKLARRLDPGLPVAGFIFTAVWFLGIKTAPAANAFSESALSWLLGYPTVIVMDVTDLAALVMLIPAWRLWLRIERADSRPAASPKFSRVAVYFTALFAVLATSPPPMPEECGIFSVRDLAVRENVVYAGLRDYPEETYLLAQSSDGGITWECVPDPPPEVQAAMGEAIASICSARSPSTCYRIINQSLYYPHDLDRIEEWIDGTQAWEVAWSPPSGRDRFQDRYPKYDLFGGNYVDQGLHDMVIVNTVAGEVLLAAAGDQGLVVRGPDGTWERRAFGVLTPVPYTAENLERAIDTTSLEGFYAYIAAIGALVVFSVQSWLRILPPSGTIGGDGRVFNRSGVLLPFTITVISILVSLFVLLFADLVLSPLKTAYSFIELLAVLVLVFALLSPPISFFWTWSRAWMNAQSYDAANRAIKLTAVGAVLVFFSVRLPFIAWAFGWLSHHSTATGMAVIAGVFASLVFLHEIRRLSLTQPINPTGHLTPNS